MNTQQKTAHTVFAVPWWRIANPANWPLLLGLGLLRLLTLLPVGGQQVLGAGLGRGFELLGARRRQVVETNLRLCFPQLDERQRRRLQNDHFAALGCGLLETALAWWGSDTRLRKLVTVDGLEHLEQARASGRGIILLTAHFTHLELGARFMTQLHSFHAMYRPHRNPLYQDIMRHYRERRSGQAAIPQNDIRGTIRALRRGGTVWYAPDHNYGRQSIFVPFFGVPAYTITATARLAEMSDALVLPYYPIREPNGRYRLVIEPTLTQFPSDDLEADTARVNQLIERWVQQAPEQYYWVHRRFKTRPPGQPRLY